MFQYGKPKTKKKKRGFFLPTLHQHEAKKKQSPNESCSEEIVRNKRPNVVNIALLDMICVANLMCFFVIKKNDLQENFQNLIICTLNMVYVQFLL